MAQICVFALLIVLSWASPFPASAETLAKKQRESLRGLDGIYLVVEELKPEVERDGLKRSDLLHDVRGKLLEGGVPLLSKEDWPKIFGAPYLYVNVQTVAVRAPAGAIYSIVIEVALEQGVTLIRDPSFVTTAATWKTQMSGIIGKEKLPDIRKVVVELVEKFINDYSSVHPKGPSGPKI